MTMLDETLIPFSAKALTILCLWINDNVALDGEILQTWPSCEEQSCQSQRADSRGPEALERLGIFAPSLDQNIQT